MKKSTVPANLSPKTMEIWVKIAKKYHITADWRPLLVEAMSALDQFDLLKKTIEDEGYQQTDRLGNKKPHCLLSSMEKCRQSFLTAWRLMNLDVLPPEETSYGEATK